LLGDPGSKFICENRERQKKKKEHTRKERKKKIQTTELNRRDQVTAAKSWPSFHRKTGAKVDNQVAAPTELGTPTMHRAKIAQQRVRMEGMATEVARLECKESTGGKEKTEREKHTWLIPAFSWKDLASWFR
jgi:hypothetical protein